MAQEPAGPGGPAQGAEQPAEAARGLKLTPPEREVVAAEAAHFAARLSQVEARQAYERLQEAAAGSGQVEEELVAALEELLGLGLATGRIRAVYGAHGEMAASSIFRRTPRGKALQQQCDEANQALRTFAGRPLEGLSISARGPGLYLLTVEIAGARAVIQLDKDGVHLRSMEFAL